MTAGSLSPPWSPAGKCVRDLLLAITRNGAVPKRKQNIILIP